MDTQLLLSMSPGKNIDSLTKILANNLTHSRRVTLLGGGVLEIPERCVLLIPVSQSFKKIIRFYFEKSPDGLGVSLSDREFA